MAFGERPLPTEKKYSGENLAYTRRDAIVTDIVSHYRDRPEVPRIIDNYMVPAGSSLAQSSMVRDLFPYAAKYKSLSPSEQTFLFEHIDVAVATYENQFLYRHRTSKGQENAYIHATAAHDILASSNLGLVAKAVGKADPLRLSTPDLAQQGAIGLVKAIRQFDLSRDIQFSTYAMYWIEQKMYRSHDRPGALQISEVIRSQWTVVSKTIDELTSQLGRQPNLDEIYESSRPRIPKSSTKFTQEQLLHLLETVGPALAYSSLDGLHSNDNDGYELIELLADPNSPDPFEEIAPSDESKKHLKKFIAGLLKQVELGKTEKPVIIMLANGVPMSRIAIELGLTEVTIEKNKYTALRKLSSFVAQRNISAPAHDQIASEFS